MGAAPACLGSGAGNNRGDASSTQRKFLVAMLAIFKAGGALLPLDPAQPSNALRASCDTARAHSAGSGVV